MKSVTTAVAMVNNVAILVVENGDKLVPIKPICDALGVLAHSQIEKIKSDEILGSTTLLSSAVGADGKEREMVCIPFKFVFGWLFTINPKNVKPEAQEALIRYKLQCYDVLYKSFTEHSEFLEQKQEALKYQMDKLQEVRTNFKNAQNVLREETNRLNSIKDLTFDQWKANQNQMKFDFMDDATETEEQE